MGRPYSVDLLERIYAYVSKGHSARAAGHVFGVSEATAVRFAAEHREGGEVTPSTCLARGISVRLALGFALGLNMIDFQTNLP